MEPERSSTSEVGFKPPPTTMDSRNNNITFQMTRSDMSDTMNIDVKNQIQYTITGKNEWSSRAFQYLKEA